MILRILLERASIKSELEGEVFEIGNKDVNIHVTAHAYEVRPDDENIPIKDRKQKDTTTSTPVKRKEDIIKCKLHSDGKSCKCKKNGAPIDTTEKDWEINGSKCKAKIKDDGADEGTSRIDLLSASKIKNALTKGVKEFLKREGNIDNIITFSKTSRKNLHLNIELDDVTLKDSSGSNRKVKQYGKIIFAIGKNYKKRMPEVRIITVYPVIRNPYHLTTPAKFTLDLDI